MNKATRSSTHFYTHHNHNSLKTLHVTQSEQLQQTPNLIQKQLFTTGYKLHGHEPTQSSVLTRNKSFSQSKSSLFSKAHSVDKKESFFMKKDGKGKNTHEFKVQLNSHKKDNLDEKVSKQLQRKLVIKKVIADLQNQKPKLTLRGQMQKLNLNNKLKHEKPLLGSHSINSQNLAYSQLQTPTKLYQKHPSNHIEQLNQSKQLCFSFVSIKNDSHSDPHFNNSSNLRGEEDKKIKNSSLFPNDSVLSKQQFNIYAKQLSQTIQASIKKELQEIYKQKELQLQQKYSAKQQAYLQRINHQLQEQLQQQRKTLMQKINSEVQGKMSKLKTDQQGKSKLQINQQFKQQNENILTGKTLETVKSKKEQRIDHESKAAQKKPIYKAQSKVNVDHEDKKIKNQEVKLVLKKDVTKQYKFIQTIKEIKTVEQQKSIKSAVGTNNNASKAAQKNVSNEKNAKTTKNYNMFENVDDSMLDQVVQINLNSTKKERKSPKNNLHTQKQKEMDNKFNKTFDIGKKMNDSFENKKKQQNDVQRKSQKSDNGVIPKQLKRKGSEQDVQKKKQREAQRAQVKKTLLQLNKNDQHLTFIGEVVAYCSKCCKKSRIQWRVPSLLLYRYCYDSYRNYTTIYESGVRLGLIKAQDFQKFISDNSILKQNLEKIYKTVIKKVELTAMYKQILTSSQIELKRLYKLVKLQVRKYAQRFRESDQMVNVDENVLRCGLRMMYSWLIIMWLQGRGKQLPNLNIQEVNGNQLVKLFTKVAKQIEQMQ